MTDPNRWDEAAEEFCLTMGKIIKMREDGQPVTHENIKAIAEVNAKLGFLAGCEHAENALRSDLLNSREQLLTAQRERDALMDGLRDIARELHYHGDHEDCWGCVLVQIARKALGEKE